jgi:hypothetical protein
VPQAGSAVVAAVAPAVLAVVVPVMAQESGMGWTLGISGEQAMAGLAEYARKIRAEADQFLPRAHHAIVLGPLSEVTPYQVPPVEAFTACPACHTMHLPLIITLRRTDELLIVVRECQHCADRWQQQESL